jgi:hypothetical protein
LLLPIICRLYPPNERRGVCIYFHDFIFIIYLFCTIRFVGIGTAQRAARRLHLLSLFYFIIYLFGTICIVGIVTAQRAARRTCTPPPPA